MTGGKGSIWRDALFLIGGASGAQLIALISAPIFTRIYDPTETGHFASIYALALVLGTVASLRYELAINLPKSRSKAIHAFYLSGLISLAVSAIAFIGAILIALYSILVTGQFTTEPSWMAVPVIALLLSFISTTSQWATREGEFAKLANMLLLGSLVTAALSLSLGILVQPTAGCLIASVIFSYCLQLLYIRGILPLAKVHNPSKFQLKKIAISYRNFAVYNFPQTLINAAFNQIPVIALAIFYDPKFAGLYWLSQRLLGVTGTVIGEAVRKTLYPRVAQIVRLDAKRNIVIYSTILLVIITIAPLILFLNFSSEIFSILFGADWSEAGSIASWMVLPTALGLINIPSVTLIMALQLQRWLLIWEAISGLVKVTTFLITHHLFNDPITSIAVLSITWSISYILLIFKGIRLAYRNLKVDGAQ